MQFTGRQLWQIFEGIVSDVNAAGKEVTSFVQVSQGCGFTYNPNNPVGGRLISLNVSNADVDFERTYNIVTLDFIASRSPALHAEIAGELTVPMNSRRRQLLSRAGSRHTAKYVCTHTCINSWLTTSDCSPRQPIGRL